MNLIIESAVKRRMKVKNHRGVVWGFVFTLKIITLNDTRTLTRHKSNKRERERGKFSVHIVRLGNACESAKTPKDGRHFHHLIHRHQLWWEFKSSNLLKWCETQ